MEDSCDDQIIVVVNARLQASGTATAASHGRLMLVAADTNCSRVKCLFTSNEASSLATDRSQSQAPGAICLCENVSAESCSVDGEGANTVLRFKDGMQGSLGGPNQSTVVLLDGEDEDARMVFLSLLLERGVSCSGGNSANEGSSSMGNAAEKVDIQGLGNEFTGLNYAALANAIAGHLGESMNGHQDNNAGFRRTKPPVSLDQIITQKAIDAVLARPESCRKLLAVLPPEILDLSASSRIREAKDSDAGAPSDSTTVALSQSEMAALRAVLGSVYFRKNLNDLNDALISGDGEMLLAAMGVEPLYVEADGNPIHDPIRQFILSLTRERVP